MDKYLNTELSFEERAEDLVSKMKIEEKCGQMKYDAPAIERLNIPKYQWWNEGLHGVARAGTATVFPQAIGLAAMFSPQWLNTAANVISLEARAKFNASTSYEDRGIYKGLTLWSPNVNIFRDPRWGRGQETYGEDPYLSGTLGTAFVRGIQGNGKYWMAAACIKHFAAHSGPEAIRHGFDSVVSEKDLEETYLYAFRTVIENTDVAGVMGAYNMVNGEPSCASDYLTHKLRDEWGFDGYFVSDCWAIRDFHEEMKVTYTPAESAALAVNHQCDLNCGCTYQHLMSAVSTGKVTSEVINRSVTRLMKTRMHLGMFDVTELDDIPFTVVDCDEHKKINLECARRSIVLLKNDNILPLDETKIKTIAVIGPNADRKEPLEGNYCGTASEYVTFLQGIKRRFSGRVIYAQGCHLYEEKVEKLAEPHDRLSEALAAAAESDIVIICAGLDATLEGEEGDTGNAYASGDKMNLRYPQPQRELIRQITATGKPCILVTASGGAMNPETKNLAAEIQVWYPGAQGGNALAEILFGDISPSGKLPVTFYKTADLLPDFIDYSMKDRTYRYLENDNNVLYPFGFGLTYGDVKVKKIKWKKGSFGGYVVAEIKNSGKYDTEDVIEIYVSINSSYEVPKTSLCGIHRIKCNAGKSKKVIIPIQLESFTIVKENGERCIDKDASYKIFADTKSPDKNSICTEITFDEIGKGQRIK